MKDIKEYLLEPYKNHSKKRIYEWFIEDLQEYYNNDIPEDVMERIHNGELFDYVLENLQTHDVKKLQDKINKYFGDKYKFEFEPVLGDEDEGKEKNSKKSFYIHGRTLAIERMYEDEDLNNLVQFYGYYIPKDHRPMSSYLMISPLYAESATDLVYKSCHGKLYHFTTKNNEESILKNGLRCKKGTYRDFPARIYCYASSRGVGPKAKAFADEVIDGFDRKKYGASVLKIDLNKIGKNIDFYTDEYMEEKEAVYTYTNIPKECITKVDVKL